MTKRGGFRWIKKFHYCISLKTEFRDVTKTYEVEVYITLYSVFKVSINEKE